MRIGASELILITIIQEISDPGNYRPEINADQLPINLSIQDINAIF